MSTTDLTYHTKAGNPIRATLYGSPLEGQKPCIIYTHGFKGFRNWGFVPHAGEFFASHGYAFLAFDFSHNGIGEDGETFSELGKFEQNTFLTEVSELDEIITQVAHTNWLGSDLKGKIGLVGHSRGGGISLLAAQNRKEIQAVATWASVSTLDRYDKATKQTWRQKGYHEVMNSRTGQTMRMGLPMLNELERFANTKLNVLSAVQNLQRPLLIVHGHNDETVPFYEAEQLNIYGSPELTHLRLIPGANHTFGATHPFQKESPTLKLLLESTLAFFDQHLA